VRFVSKPAGETLFLFCLFLWQQQFWAALFSPLPLQKKHVQIMVLFENTSH
jgi:hypothetical protein